MQRVNDIVYYKESVEHILHSTEDKNMIIYKLIFPTVINLYMIMFLSAML